ncbi:MAG: DUF58 domain-containing protein [Wenzhouxiangellaceae bacterium]|nr:DUF58 domain-containing protein [Wenzhouxiangellaceae bacterium]
MPLRVPGVLREALDRWIRRRGPVRPPLELRYRQIFILPTGFGTVLGVLLFAMLLGSLNFNNNLGLFTTFLVAGIALLSLHAAYRDLEGVEVHGMTAPRVFAGDLLEIDVHLVERRGRPRRALVVALPGAATSAGGVLGADGRGHLRLAVPVMRRGRYEPGRLRIRSRWPLGLFEAWSWFWPGRAFTVWPRPAAKAPPVPAGSDAEAGDRAGDESDEFHGLREWREGDALHRIAWKASQRHRTLLARQFARPRPGRRILRLAEAPGASLEDRLSVLTRWVLDCEAAEIEYGLDLGTHGMLAPGRGDAHRTACLDLMAAHP